jgi:hypothetical protein
MTNGIAYLCGHLHTLGGLMPNLYTRHTNGLLELELADWKVNRIFRIMAFDGGIFSFNDYSLTKSIFVLITNPKNMQFKTEREPMVIRIKRSTHIRFLVFSKHPVVKCDVYINDNHIGNANRIRNPNSTTPLYVLPWNLSQYKHGIHTLKVVVLVSFSKSLKMNQIIYVIKYGKFV